VSASDLPVLVIGAGMAGLGVRMTPTTDDRSLTFDAGGRQLDFLPAAARALGLMDAARAPADAHGARISPHGANSTTVAFLAMPQVCAVMRNAARARRGGPVDLQAGRNGVTTGLRKGPLCAPNAAGDCDVAPCRPALTGA
jgi:hypothetical protein